MIRSALRGGKTLQKTVADNVRRRREGLGLSQEAFADLCGYHRTYIGAIERGDRNITLATLFAIANTLKVEPQQLLEQSDG
jgi:transcriptional regulator with XRE-family HTH domain